MRLINTILLLGLSILAHAQIEYIGAGENTEGVTVSASNTSNGTSLRATIDGSGLDAKAMEASRLLSQVSIGYEERHVYDVMDMGIEAWVDAQLEMQPISFIDKTEYFWRATSDTIMKYLDVDTLSDAMKHPLIAPRVNHINYAWWWNAMNHEDLIRQRLAFALSEIFVISLETDLADRARAAASYVDLLFVHSLGNFRDLLEEVSLSPAMGFYLSHLNNPKTDVEANTKPDENYAREIMQLFTIGLYELNPDGSRKKDNDGDDIPTYDNRDIKELAKVFTGLGGSGLSEEFLKYLEEHGEAVPEVDFGYDMYTISGKTPLKMYEEWHEPGQKVILKKHTIPSGQTGMKDINDALDILFNHPNVGPFISKQLIQKMIKSNPTPQYVERVARVFDDNGGGVRGDLKAVVRAILLDDEARTCEWQQDSYNGKLREPLLRYTQFMRFIDKNLTPYYGDGYLNMVTVNQNPFAAPSVFNFYRPDFQPLGPLAQEDLVGPVFQIHNSQTSIGYFNFVHHWTFWNHLSSHGEIFPEEWDEKVVKPIYTALEAMEDEEMINYLDIMLAGGRLSEETRVIIREALLPMRDWDPMYAERARMACYLIMVSPDYTIQK